MWVYILLFIVGLVLVIKGGDWFVDAATWAADVTGIPKFIIGATVVSLATTLPELLVSLFAAFDGKVDIAIGNAVGSVTANTALIMAISMLFLPAVAKRASVGFKSLCLIGALALLLVFSLDGKLRVWQGAIVILIFVLSTWESIREGKKATKERVLNQKVTFTRREVLVNVVKFVGGAAAIVVGADLMVDNGSEIARVLGVSEAIIGATIIAVGTSLPELVTTITAIAKKEASLSIGNIIGANVIDITLIMPLCTILSGKALPVTGQNQVIDIPGCLLISLVALVPIFIREKYSRFLGGILLALYGGYLYFVISGNWTIFAELFA